MLLVYDAELEIVSAAGTRRVPYDRFHTGYKQMDLAPGEIIARIHLPSRDSWLPAAGGRDYYRKVGTRRAQAIAKVCFAGAIRVEGKVVQDVRIALGSVAPTGSAFPRRRRCGRTLDLDPIAADERTLLSDQAIDESVDARYRARVAGNYSGICMRPPYGSLDSSMADPIDHSESGTSPDVADSTVPRV